MLVHPAIADSYATALDGAVSGESTHLDLPAAALDGPDLLRRFAAVSDGRPGQGRDHPVAVVLTLCAAAVLAGMRSFTAIAGWVADVPMELLAQLHGLPVAGCGAKPLFPSKSTLWRVLTGVDAAAVDAAVGAWLHAQAAARKRAPADTAATGQGADDDATLVAIAVDGKTVRGAIDADGAQVHLLAAATHDDCLVLGQVEVGAKSNEIPQFAPLLGGLAAAGVDLTNAVITADALHTQRAHAEYLHSVGAQFVLTAKQNQPRLFAALDALAWAEVPIAHREVEHGHGRATTRTIQVLPAPADLPFPHVNQVWLIERYIHDTTGALVSSFAALGVTSLTATRATPAEIAGLVRRHWGIESLHWLRDTVYREDHSTARTGSGPRVMAALPRDRRHPPPRTPRHHRSDTLGNPRHGPTIQDPAAHHMINDLETTAAMDLRSACRGRCLWNALRRQCRSKKIHQNGLEYALRSESGEMVGGDMSCVFEQQLPVVEVPAAANRAGAVDGGFMGARYRR